LSGELIIDTGGTIVKAQLVKSQFQLKLWRILFMVIFLIGCQPIEEEVRGEISPTQTDRPFPTPFPSSTPTEILSSPTPETSPFNGERLPFLQPQERLTSEFSDEEFQDLIIFNHFQSASAAFANFSLNINWAEGMESHIYAFSPDGRRAGTFIPENFASTLHLPSNPSEKPMLVEYGVEFNHPAVQGIELPSECYQPKPDEDQLFACGNFQFSPDGQYLGFFYGPPECWRGIIVQNTQTGEQPYHSSSQNGHSFQLFADGKALISTGHCEGGGVTYYDFDDGTEIPLGSEGGQTWNVDNTAFAVESGSYAGIDRSIWGFNLESEQLFMKRLEQPQLDDHPVWTPDNQYLIYQHRTFSLAKDGFYPTGFETARQIILVDAQTGNQKQLLSDPAYDFHLGSCPTCAQWFGDWIQIRRVAFAPEPITGGDAMYTSQAFTCRVYAQNCASPVELFALNWKTGELKPWTELVNSGVVPDPNLTPTPLAPTPDQKPIFEVPDQY
jgi:hypothetical protein